MMLVSLITKSQNSNDSLFVFEAKVLSSDSLLPIANAHIISKHTLRGTISVDSGFFNLRVNRNDSLMISSMGFSNKLFIITDSVIRIKKPANILLDKDTIMLNEVIIRAFWDYEIFKQLIIDMRLPDEIQIMLNNDNMILNRPLQPSVTGPVQALYNVFNHTAKLQRKLLKNRIRYNKMMIQMGRINDTIPAIPEHMREMQH
jgi:hypothetical protein